MPLPPSSPWIQGECRIEFHHLHLHIYVSRKDGRTTISPGNRHKLRHISGKISPFHCRSLLVAASHRLFHFPRQVLCTRPTSFLYVGRCTWTLLDLSSLLSLQRTEGHSEGTKNKEAESKKKIIKNVQLLWKCTAKLLCSVEYYYYLRCCSLLNWIFAGHRNIIVLFFAIKVSNLYSKL